MNELLQDKIDAYLLNRMNESEKIEFEELLNKNQELKEHYQFTKTVRSELKDRTEKTRLLQTINEKGKTNRFRKIALTSSAITGIAAVFILVFFIKYPSGSFHSMPVLDMEYYDEYRANGDIQSIAIFINEKKYKEALVKIQEEEQEIAELSMSDTIQYNSLTPEEKERVEYETKVYKRDRMELEWLKLHVYIGLNNKEEFNRIIKKIISEDGVHQADAKKLYESLK